MTSIHLYHPKYADAWNDFVSTSKNGTFLLDRKFMDYHADRFQDHSLMFFDEKQNLQALFPANLAGSILYSHQGLTYGGFLTSIKMKATQMLSCFQELKDYCVNNGISKLIYKTIPSFYHFYPADEDLYALFRFNAKLIRRDISSTIFIPKKPRFSSGKRSTLNKAQKAGVTVQKTDRLHEFMQILNENLQSRYHTRAVHSEKELLLLMDKFPNNISLYGAFIKDQLLAGCIIFEMGHTCHIQYISSSPEGKKMSVLDLLFAKLIEEVYKERQYLDFGTSCEQGGYYLNEGLIRQKELFGARATCYDTYELLF